MPEFYTIFARKKVFVRIWGGAVAPPLLPVSYAYGPFRMHAATHILQKKTHACGVPKRHNFRGSRSFKVMSIIEMASGKVTRD